MESKGILVDYKKLNKTDYENALREKVVEEAQDITVEKNREGFLQVGRFARSGADIGGCVQNQYVGNFRYPKEETKKIRRFYQKAFYKFC